MLIKWEACFATFGSHHFERAFYTLGIPSLAGHAYLVPSTNVFCDPMTSKHDMLRALLLMLWDSRTPGPNLNGEAYGMVWYPACPGPALGLGQKNTFARYLSLHSTRGNHEIEEFRLMKPLHRRWTDPGLDQIGFKPNGTRISVRPLHPDSDSTPISVNPMTHHPPPVSSSNLHVPGARTVFFI